MAGIKEICLAIILSCSLYTTWADSNAPLPLPYASSYDTADKSLAHDAESSPGSYIHHFDKGSDGYAIQSGYETYIVPPKTHKLAAVKEGIIQHFVNFLEPVINFGVAVLPKVGLALATILILLAVGTFLTSCVCAYTSMCHMTFLGYDLTKDQVRAFMDQDGLSEISQMLRTAVKKYQDLQVKKSQETKENQVK